MPQIELPNLWNPRKHQLPLWRALEGGVRRAVAIFHRRAGKDSVSLNWTACEAMEHPGVYWHMAPTQKQVRKILWNGVDKDGRKIMKQAFPDAIVKRRRDDEMLTEFVNGSIHQCVGSDNFDSLVGANPRGVVFSEWSLANPRAWDFIRPILVENGGWAIFIYTPRGRNHGLRLYELAKSQPGWFCQLLTIEDTGMIGPEVIDQERKELVIQHGEEWADSIIRQEWFCDFDAPVLGTYYAKRLAELEAAGRVGLFPHLPGIPVHTAWDIGIADAMVVWFFQIIGTKVRLIDYMEGSGHGLSWYVNRLEGLERWGEDNRALEVVRPIEGLERRRAYTFGTHYGPHDAANSEVGTGRRRVDVLFDIGVQMHVLPRVNVADGISAVRQFVLADVEFNVAPGAPIDDPMSVARGLDALRNYRRKWSDERQCFVDTPLHDWCSDPADALRYAALGLQMEPPKLIEAPYEPPFGSMEWIEAQERAARDEDTADDVYYR